MVKILRACVIFRGTEAKVFQKGIVLYSGREVIPFREKLFAVPFSVLNNRREVSWVSC